MIKVIRLGLKVREMGANNSTRRVSFESDENDNITVVKGVRVSVTHTHSVSVCVSFTYKHDQCVDITHFSSVYGFRVFDKTSDRTTFAKLLIH